MTPMTDYYNKPGPWRLREPLCPGCGRWDCPTMQAGCANELEGFVSNAKLLENTMAVVERRPLHGPHRA